MAVEEHLYHPNRVQRWIQRTAATRAVSAMMAPLLHYLDRPIIRLSKGRTSLTGILTGIPVITLTMKGAKSGLPRSVPVFTIQEGDNLILVASNFGQKSHPAWYYNLLANPEAIVSIRGESRKYLAQMVSEPERERYWKLASGLYAGYLNYRQWARQRQIGIFLLQPVEIVEGTHH